jgi:bifunctional non-homologous end joining protein LigD
VCGMPWSRRRELLGELVVGSDRLVVSSAHRDGDGLWAATREHRLEGVVAKRVDAVYRSGRRSPDWVKANHTADRSYLVIGVDDTRRRPVYLVGDHDESGDLRIAGRIEWTSPGVTPTLAGELRPAVSPPPGTRGRRVRWVEPTPVVVRSLLSGPELREARIVSVD